MECPYADLSTRISKPHRSTVETLEEIGQEMPVCPFHRHAGGPYAIKEVLDASKTWDTRESSQLLRDIGGGDRIREMCTRFYARAFEDSILKPFFFNDDGATQHAKRLGDWIIEKMGGEGTPWSDSGRSGLRQETHFKAWFSKKRDVKDRGTRFQLGIDFMRIMHIIGFSINPTDQPRASTVPIISSKHTQPPFVLMYR